MNKAIKYHSKYKIISLKREQIYFSFAIPTHLRSVSKLPSRIQRSE